MVVSIMIVFEILVTERVHRFHRFYEYKIF